MNTDTIPCLSTPLRACSSRGCRRFMRWGSKCWDNERKVYHPATAPLAWCYEHAAEHAAKARERRLAAQQLKPLATAPAPATTASAGGKEV